MLLTIWSVYKWCACVCVGVFSLPPCRRRRVEDGVGVEVVVRHGDYFGVVAETG